MGATSPVFSEPVAGTFTHLHVHTHFSLLDGAAQIKPLVARAKAHGFGALAITDHGAMYGIIPFYEECLKQGIRPILGVEAYLAARTRHDRDPRHDAKSYHQLLLAENFEGYKNLLKLVSEAHLNGIYYKPRIDLDLLREHSAGIIATSSCAAGMLPRAVMTSEEEGERVLDIFLGIFGPDRYFIELQSHTHDAELSELDRRLRALAAKRGVPVIATNDVHYIDEEDSDAQDVLVCVSSGKQVTDPHRLDMRKYDLSLASAERMRDWFADIPEALENTVKLAERCRVEIPMGVNILPKYPLPAEALARGLDDRTYLRELCSQGMRQRFKLEHVPDASRPDGLILASPLNDPALPVAERAVARLEYELSVIENMGFESYFLITQDFLNWARSQNIMVGPGRGSAAGSLVGYLLGITDVDPLFHNLIFERFLNPERVSMPDIDNDIEDSRRDEVIAYVREQYGADHVAQIITFGTMAARNAVRDVGRAMGVSYAECDHLAKLIPTGPGGMTLPEALENIDELKLLYGSNGQIREVVDIASRLEGCARHHSIHAAGVVISKEVLTEYLPVQRATKDEAAIVTQYAMNDVEHIGLLKIDFLGLSNLSIIQQALRVILATRGVTIDLSTLEVTDKKSYELLARAETTGVFQLESAGMKRYLRELKPSVFEDIVAMVALYRPGPMDAIPDFIEAKHGRKKVTYLHPILEPILKDSYGVIVTQDQVLEVARKFAGFSYGQADVLRKAVGKKIKAMLDEQRDKFIAGAVATNGVELALAEKVWDFVEPFARYGFNRAHAVSYGMISYQTAYLKANFPVEFMAALLTSDTGNLDRITIESAECKVMGIELLPPDVNESFVEFGAIPFTRFGEVPHGKRHDSYVRFGLGAIKNVGLHPAALVVDERRANGRYADLTDFLRRCCGALNKKVLENLVMAGALDEFGERGYLLANVETMTLFCSQVHKHAGSPQLGMFANEDATSHYRLHLQPAEPANEKDQLRWERELLGVYLTQHPLAPYAGVLPAERANIGELLQEGDGELVRVCGIVMGLREIVTKKDSKPMAFCQLEDETGAAEAVFFPKTWANVKDKVVEGAALCVEGKLSRKESRNDPDVVEAKVLADSVTVLSDEEPPEALERVDRLLITVPASGDRDLLQRIKKVLDDNRGAVPVTLRLPAGDGHQEMPIRQRIAANPYLLSRLIQLVGPDGVLAK